jgi:hypothetical protein
MRVLVFLSFFLSRRDLARAADACVVNNVSSRLTTFIFRAISSSFHRVYSSIIHYTLSWLMAQY